MCAVGLSTSRNDASSEVSRVEDMTLQSEAPNAVPGSHRAALFLGGSPSPVTPPLSGPRASQATVAPVTKVRSAGWIWLWQVREIEPGDLPAATPALQEDHLIAATDVRLGVSAVHLVHADVCRAFAELLRPSEVHHPGTGEVERAAATTIARSTAARLGRV